MYLSIKEIMKTKTKVIEREIFCSSVFSKTTMPNSNRLSTECAAFKFVQINNYSHALLVREVKKVFCRKTWTNFDQT